jgi:nitroreductase
MDFSEIVASRYATKQFDGRPVPQEKIDALLEMVRFAPSSYNIQPWRIKVVTDQETKRELRAVSRDQEQITSCSHLLVFCVDTNLESLISDLVELKKSDGATDDAIERILSGINKKSKSYSEAEISSWLGRQVFLALGNAVNGAKALGFDSCPMDGFDQEGCSRILKLPKGIVPLALCPVGYAADTPKKKLRFQKEHILL